MIVVEIVVVVVVEMVFVLLLMRMNRWIGCIIIVVPSQQSWV